MIMEGGPKQGIGLEARVQRVFMAQGLLAERRLQPATSSDHRMLATDIDVLVSEYGSGFHLTRRHAECKGGNVPVLDRILWLNGVRSLLGADASYLVLKDVDYNAARFANDLDVQLLSERQIGNWEAALGVPNDVWPCRSEFQSFEVARSRWAKLSGAKNADEPWRFLRTVLGFIEIDSWHLFQYRHLNRLFRYLQLLGELFPKVKDDIDKALCCKYCASSALVRLAQYLLAVCLEVSPVASSDLRAHLTERLTFGDQDPRRVVDIVGTTVEWVRRALAAKGSTMPPEIDVSRLYASPPYSAEFAELVSRLLEKPDEAIRLPVALEVALFDNRERLGRFPRLQAAASEGDGLAALVIGFIIRSTAIPKDMLEGLGTDIRGVYRSTGARKAKTGKGTVEQLSLESGRL